MSKAIKLAQKGIGKTNPNPPVGAIIVKNNKIIGQGFHSKAGQDHAEITALKQAGENAKNAGLYVTLEPCSTYGKTPPCTDKIISSGIKHVFIGSIDPNKLNKNKSLKILEKAGIIVETGILKDKTDILIEAFDTFINKKRPFFIMKTAISLDGRIATEGGDSKWITSEESRKYAHKLRNSVDAILVGKNTLLKDNPCLNVRGIKNPNHPYKIILSSNQNISHDLNIFKDDPEKVLIFNNLQELCEKAYKLNIMRVLIEGGSIVYKSFLEAKLIDKIYFFISPRIIGKGKLCIPQNFLDIKTINQSLMLKNVSYKQINQDILVQGYIS